MQSVALQLCCLHGQTPGAPTMPHTFADLHQDVEEKLEAELDSGLGACVDEVTGLVAPLGEATAAAVARLQDAEARRSQLAEQLEALQQRAAAVE